MVMEGLLGRWTLCIESSHGIENPRDSGRHDQSGDLRELKYFTEDGIAVTLTLNRVSYHLTKYQEIHFKVLCSSFTIFRSEVRPCLLRLPSSSSSTPRYVCLVSRTPSHR